MPISSGGIQIVKDKSRCLGVHGKPVTTNSGATQKSKKKVSTIEPSLPLLPAVPRPPRLQQRSNTTLNVPTGGGGDMAPCSIAVLQTNNEGKIHATRSQKERDKYPDRVSLDRRGLTVLPVLVGESRVRLLSLQHNLITRLDNISSLGLSRLVFLDVYDNQLDRIAGLDSLDNLRVLLLGKNRIRRMEGLQSLARLEVLDLHGNQLSGMGGALCSLRQLKVLNLAGNRLRSIGPLDLRGLRSLQELNLRRNRINRLMGFAETPRLTKLFLSNNELHSVDDMSSLAKAVAVREVTIDGNPVSLSGDSVSFLVAYMPQLQMLSHVQVTDQVRQAAMLWRANKESTNAAFCNLAVSEGSSDVVDPQRDEVIFNARTNWELLRSQTAATMCNSVKLNCSSSLMDLREVGTSYNDALKGSASSVSFSNIVPSETSLPLSARAVRIPERLEARRSVYCRRRTSSQDTPAVPTPSNELEYFRLPPILVPLINPEAAREDNIDAQADQVTLCSTNDLTGSMKQCERERCVESSLSSIHSESSDGEESDSSEDKRERCIRGAVNAHRNVKSAAPQSSQSRRLSARSRPQTARAKPKGQSNPGRMREQGGDYLVEINGRYLNVFGQGALRFIDRPWNPVKAGDVSTVKFNYVNFNSLIPALGRLKQRFPNAEYFHFCETNISCLGQLNALADIQGLTSLTINEEGNSIANKKWRSYAIYRLSHWGLRIVNETEVSDEELMAATAEYDSLSELVMESLPECLLQPLLSRLRLVQDPGGPAVSARQWLSTVDPALRAVVAKEALQWRRTNFTQEDLMWRQKGRLHLYYLLEQTCSAVAKLRQLEAEWPSILGQLVRDILVDYSHIDSYMKQCMNELMN